MTLMTIKGKTNLFSKQGLSYRDIHKQNYNATHNICLFIVLNFDTPLNQLT